MKLALLLLAIGLVIGLSSPQLPDTQTAVAGVSTNIIIPCNLGRQEQAPFWFINQTAYELFSIPLNLPQFIPVVDSYTELTIPIVRNELNDTIFRCAIFDADGDIELGIVTRLIVIQSNESVETPEGDILRLDYQDLYIGENATTLSWVFDTCSTVFMLQGFNLSSVLDGVSTLTTPEFEYTFNGSSTGEIPYRTVTGDPVIYRLVAVDESEDVCSQMATLETFFRFDVSERLETRVLAPNSTTCYDIPVTDVCTSSLSFVWPLSLDLNSGLSCFCPVYNSPGGRVAFENCTCQGAEVFPWLSENGSVCLLDWDSNLNGTRVFFQCSTDPCVGDCFITTVISQHRIIISGSPSAPTITYNSSDGALCFSAYSHAEFPVLGFDVEVTDMTRIRSELTGIYTTSLPFCVTITSDPAPNVCSPFQVSATAFNEIGNSSEGTFTYGNGGGSSCLCYMEREQTNVNVSSVTANSATLSLACGLDQTDTVDYILEDQSTSQDDVRAITLQCGDSQRVTNLSSDANYTLLRLYGEETCTVTDFTTDLEAPNMRTSNVSTILAVVIPVGLVALIAVVITVIVVVVCKLRVVSSGAGAESVKYRAGNQVDLVS